MDKNTNNLRAFDTAFDSLSVSSDGLVLRGHQIVVQTRLRWKVVNIAHEGHIVKTKQSLRQKVWFPYLGRLVETKVGRCIPCQACTHDNIERMVPLENRQPPEAVWQTGRRLLWTTGVWSLSHCNDLRNYRLPSCRSSDVNECWSNPSTIRQDVLRVWIPNNLSIGQRATFPG